MRPTFFLIALIVVAGCGDREPTTRLSPAARNRLLGDRYLAENAKREGVVALPSKMQYRVLKQGDGARPTMADVVTFHYRGTTIDGREFETSRDLSQSAVTLPMRNLIRGWQEGLQLMASGSIYEFVIPGHLAYGVQGEPPKIEPNQCLVFTVELIGVNLPAP
ncbi:MAG TPA: FKBP-type peptidyl-prolyl cis-trans isomerase [Planctomycetota bacterium]|nr:FKBP-type peptidyl-prolyl cis-trans isomerase [Planctomycetota bacterium]